MNIKMSTKKPIWIKTHQALYNSLYGKYIIENPDINYDTFIEDNVKNILPFIMKSRYTDGSKKNQIFMCARRLEIVNNPNHKAYSEAGFKLRQEIEKAEKENRQSTKETVHYRDHQYFYQLIENMKPTVDTMTYKEHIQFLLLCMLTLQPVVRTSYYISAKYISQSAKNKGDDNYILLNAKNPKTATYIVNNDKVSKSYYYKTNKGLSNIVIEDKYLTTLLFESFKKYPRQYLLQKNPDDDEGITQNTYLRWLRTVTDIEGIDNDIMRSSYVTWYYKHISSEYTDKEKLAHQMRHSVTAASVYYNKKIPSETDEPPLVTEELEKYETKKIDVKKYAKMRYDVIFRLNNNDKLTPRQASIDKYNLEYNDKTKKWF